MTRRRPVGVTWMVILCAAALLPSKVALAGPDTSDTHGRPATAAASPASPPSQTIAVDPAAMACPRTLLTSYDPNKGEFFGHDVSVWTLGEDDSPAVLFQSGMTIDADGAPNAYNPHNTGLDDLANAGTPDHWDGIVTDRDGTPYIQGPGDPFPGFYVSQTALVDWNKQRNDPARFVDASKIPYIVLPAELSRQIGARLGDFVVVFNQRRNTSAYAIFADIGTLGEGSIALADELGIWSDAREGGTRGGILYLLYPGSGDRQPHTLDEINTQTEKLFEAWGGKDRLNSCAPPQQTFRGPGPGPAAGAGPAGDQVATKNFH
jgi:hypothetical protein